MMDRKISYRIESEIAVNIKPEKVEGLKISYRIERLYSSGSFLAIRPRRRSLIELKVKRSLQRLMR